MREDGTLTKEQYDARKMRNDEEILKLVARKEELEQCSFDVDEKGKALKAIRQFIDSSLEFTSISGEMIAVPKVLVDTYIEQIIARANNVFEYYIRVNAHGVTDGNNSNLDEEVKASLLVEFSVDYETAKEYANRRQRKVARVHWTQPATIRIFACI